MTEYNKAAVDRAIALNRPAIGSKEAKAIHALLTGRATPAKWPGGGTTMSKERFVDGLKALGHNVSTANRLLGVGRSTIYRMSTGTAEVPEVVCRLMDMYERFGVPEEHKGAPKP